MSVNRRVSIVTPLYKYRDNSRLFYNLKILIELIKILILLFTRKPNSISKSRCTVKIKYADQFR